MFWAAASPEQAAGNKRFDDDWIRVALMRLRRRRARRSRPWWCRRRSSSCCAVRPRLAGAQQAARDGDDQLLAGYFFEAMRFDPLGPALPRVATQDTVIAAGTSRADNRAEGRHGLRRLQLGHDGRAAAARSAILQSAAAAS